MPHHSSAQKRHANAFVAGSTAALANGSPGGFSAGGASRSPVVPTSTHGAVDFRILPQGGPTSIRGASLGMASWSPSQAGGGQLHRVHSDQDATHRSFDGSTPTSRSTGSFSREESHSFDSPHEVAASVLLLAARVTREKEALMAKRNEDDIVVPLKKRKTAAEIMRKKVDDSAACHISPHSDNSKIHSTPDATPVASNTPTSKATSNASSSYDLKDGQALPDSAKVNDTKEITPPSHVEIPHFPSVLHAVLTESEFAGKVLHWLPHGQAWKIIRWDALRKQCLPKYFNQLREEDSKDGSASIDAFLWHLSAWGFEEVTDGPDAGAYSHVLFRRELPGLCHQMRFAPALEKSSPYGHDGHHRVILQVPSLTSAGGGSISSGRMIEEKKEEYPSSVMHAGEAQGWPQRIIGGHVTVGYRPEGAAAQNEAWKHFSEAAQWVGSSSSSPGQRSVPQYSPIRVRSGRGAGRLPVNRQMHVEASPVPVTRPSFPVSNRGKGTRGRRISIPGNESLKTEPSAEVQMTTTISTRPADGAVPEASSPEQPRAILKRKLPLARKSSHDSTSSSERQAPENSKEQDNAEDTASDDSSSSSSSDSETSGSAI